MKITKSAAREPRGTHVTAISGAGPPETRPRTVTQPTLSRHHALGISLAATVEDASTMSLDTANAIPFRRAKPKPEGSNAPIGARILPAGSVAVSGEVVIPIRLRIERPSAA